MESSQPPPPPPPPPPQQPQPPQQQYYSPAPKRPPIESSRLRPRARWYWLTALPLVIGAVAATLLAIATVDAFPDEPDAFTAPGGPTKQLEGGEDYTIFTRSPESEFDARPDPPTPDCEVVSLPGGDRVELDDAGNTTLTFGGSEYETALHLTAPRTGRYEVSCQPGSAFGAQGLAFGERPNLGRFGVLLGSAIASLVLALLLAAAIVAVVAVRRHRHKRRLQDEAMAGQ